MSAKRPLKKIIILVLALAIPLGIGYASWLCLRSDEIAGESQVTVHRVGSCQRDVEETIQARGILQCAESVPVTAGVRGRIMELLPQGSVVKKGDVLFRIDDTQSREQIENDTTNYNTAELNLVKLEAEFQLTDFQESQQVLLMDARLKHAELEQQEELKKPDGRDQRLMEIEEELSQLDVDDAEDEFLREQRMFKKGYISAASLESVEQRLANAKAALAELKLQNTLTKKGATKERRVELQKAVDRAKFRLARAEARKARRINSILAQQDEQRKEMERLNYFITYHTAELDKATTYAPMDGVFMLMTYRDWTTGGTLKERAVGDEQGRHDIVGHVINPEKMEVHFAIHESDFHRLHEGMPVEVTIPAVKNSRYTGHLERLGAIGRDRNHVDPTGILGGDSEISMFNAVISLDMTGKTFHPGMSAVVDIKVKHRQDELLIPRGALISMGTQGQLAVRMADGEMRTVKGRYFNHMYFAVDSGLKPDEEIEIRKHRSVSE